jgi:hypothetical protein
MLRFDEHGVGFAHLTLPADTYGSETGKLRIAAQNLLGCIHHRVCYLTGQSDVMLEMRLTDLRSAFRFEYNSEASGTNWLFGVPYLPSLHRAPEPEKLALTYVVHLRVVRDVFRAKGVAAEQEIVPKIQSLLTGDIRGEVLAGFGWSDLMVSGTFDTIDSIVRTVKQIQKLEVDGRLALRRVLTLVGYDASVNISKPTDVKVRPVMLARAAPTRIRETAEMLRQRIDPDKKAEWTATSIDGKWDILLQLSAGEPLPLDAFIARHRSLAESNTFASTGLERLETHLLTNTVDDIVHDKTDDEKEKPFIPPRCSCQEAVLPLSAELERLLAEVKPSPLATAIKNVLGLFRAASQDPHNCCEVASILRRCEIGLKLLLQHRSDVVREMTDAEKIGRGTDWKSPVFWYHWFTRVHVDIQDWCTYAERIVSQRTVGRFEEFLSQNERVVSYRGGVQKLLYLADALLNSYAKKVRSDADESLPMVCLFDPVDIVLSHRYAGLVRMPSRYLFVLPLAINHLWHEVGVYAFHQKYVSPRDKVTAERLRRVALTRPAEAGESSTRREMSEFTLDLGDVSADAMTLIHGFRGDLKPFIVAFATALFETPNFKLAPSGVKDEFLVYLLLRLYLASECSIRAMLTHPRDAKANPNENSFDPAKVAEWRPNARHIDDAIQCIVGYLRHELLVGHPRYADISISGAVIEFAIANVNETVQEGFRPFINDIVLGLKEYPDGISNATQSAFERVVKGNLVDLAAEGVDINDVFRLLQIQMIEELRETPPGISYPGSFFRPIAALMRSSILSFYKGEKTTSHATVAGFRSLGGT